MASSIEVCQSELVRACTDAVMRTLDGTAAVMHAGGRGARLNTLRYGREPHRPPCVTLEPRRDGALVLGLVVSRPKSGKFVYDKTLGEWDITAPLRSGGPLNIDRPEHRRALFWGFDLLRALLHRCRAHWATGVDLLDALTMPRTMIPFVRGQAKIDAAKQALFPGLTIDSNLLPGRDVVDSRIVHDADVMSAINNNLAAEDFSPVLGPTVPNSFTRFDGGGLQGEELLAALRRGVNRAHSSGATDADLLNALEHPDQPLRLSLFSRVQIVGVDSLMQLPFPYGGSMLPALDWQLQKKNPVMAVK